MIWCFAGKLNQVLLNILMNAIQAVDDGATITVADLRRTRRRPRSRSSISDDGPGIPESIREKIFDPFFTTKPQGLGTGLGLWISYNIVQEHQGRIDLQTEVRTGDHLHASILPIRLPATLRSEASIRSPWPTAPPLVDMDLPRNLDDDFSRTLTAPETRCFPFRGQRTGSRGREPRSPCRTDLIVSGIARSQSLKPAREQPPCRRAPNRLLRRPLTDAARPSTGVLGAGPRDAGSRGRVGISSTSSTGSIAGRWPASRPRRAGRGARS